MSKLRTKYSNWNTTIVMFNRKNVGQITSSTYENEFRGHFYEQTGIKTRCSGGTEKLCLAALQELWDKEHDHANKA